VDACVSVKCNAYLWAGVLALGVKINAPLRHVGRDKCRECGSVGASPGSNPAHRPRAPACARLREWAVTVSRFGFDADDLAFCDADSRCVMGGTESQANDMSGCRPFARSSVRGRRVPLTRRLRGRMGSADSDHQQRRPYDKESATLSTPTAEGPRKCHDVMLGLGGLLGKLVLPPRRTMDLLQPQRSRP